MPQHLIILDGIVHGVKTGTGMPIRSWCGVSLREWTRLGGYFSPMTDQEMGYEPAREVNCLGCLAEGS